MLRYTGFRGLSEIIETTRRGLEEAANDDNYRLRATLGLGIAHPLHINGHQNRPVITPTLDVTA